MEGWIFVGLAAVLAVVLLFVGHRSLRRKRLIENVPTSKVEGVFLGLTEVKGAAETHAPVRTYLAEREAVYYRFEVAEEWRKHETYRDSKGNTRTRVKSGWRTIRSGEVRRPFSLRDDTGALRVDPAGAEVEADCIFSKSCGVWDPIYYAKGPRYAIAHSTHRRRFTEYAIAPGQSLYVLGTARLREDVVEPELAQDPDSEMFLISTSSEERLVRSYAWKTRLSHVFGWLSGAAAPVIYMAAIRKLPFGEALAASALVIVLITATYFAVAGLLYLQLVYNGLIDVKNRLARAWSLIDIQLKRRHDLIPNLVAAVKRYAAHEQELLQGVADLRADAVSAAGGVGGLPDPAVALAMGQAIDGQTLALGKLFGVVERYPHLKADRGFLQLDEELCRTERKIALARAFYNDSVTAYNNRLTTVPDLLVARPLGLPQGAYLTIAEFEKQPVAVRFQADPEPPPLELDFAGEAVPEDAAVLSAEDLEAERQRARSAGEA